jgi:hypothetical protein
MSVIHIQSVDDPFDAPEVARIAVTTFARAEAMGLLPQGEVIEALDYTTLQKVMKGISRAGIGQGVMPDLARAKGRDAKHLSVALQRLNDALDASPVPASEWPGLSNILGIDLLARLVGVSAVSLRRYASGTRPTPDEVAARLHFLALVVGDLVGAYNDIGIRRWFDRSRTLLGNQSPAQILTRKWRSEDQGPQQVRQLAHALIASPAT